MVQLTKSTPNSAAYSMKGTSSPSFSSIMKKFGDAADVLQVANGVELGDLGPEGGDGKVQQASAALHGGGEAEFGFG